MQRFLFYCGAKYTDMHADYTGKGFDQLADVIDKIKNSPDDRRIILSAWNPWDLKKMALPPCHMFAQSSRLENLSMSSEMLMFIGIMLSLLRSNLPVNLSRFQYWR